MEDPEAARLHDGLRGIFQTLLRAIVGVRWEPDLHAEWPPLHEFGMVTTPGEFIPAGPPSLEIAWAKDLESLEEARRVTVASSGDGPLLAMYEPEVAAIPGVRIYVGRLDDEPVTTAIGWTAHAATGIVQVATAPPNRSRGYARAVTSRAVLEGFGAGADLAWLQASGPGQRLYRNLGFRPILSRCYDVPQQYSTATRSSHEKQPSANWRRG
jgi:hypothetical protein